jgi:hypothetical protein
VRADYRVVLDACVLIPMPWSDTLLRMAEAPRLYLPRWSELIIVHELLHFSVPNHGKLRKSPMRAHLGDYELHRGTMLKRRPPIREAGIAVPGVRPVEARVGNGHPEPMPSRLGRYRLRAASGRDRIAMTANVSPSCARVAGGRWCVVFLGRRAKEFGEDGLQRICPHLVCLDRGV